MLHHFYMLQLTTKLVDLYIRHLQNRDKSVGLYGHGKEMGLGCKPVGSIYLMYEIKSYFY